MSGYALVFSGPARLAQLLPQELPIASFPFSLGRGAAADGCVHATPQLLGLGTQSDAIISRAHAVLEMTPTGVCVRDLGSVNGTWVLLSSLDRQDCGSDRVRAGSGPGRKIRLAKDGITEHQVVAGDQISIGNKLVRYMLVQIPPRTDAVLAPPATQLNADTRPSTVECPWALEGRSGSVCWVHHERVTMGRGDRADFVVTGGDSFMQTSRVHCVLVYKHGQLYLEDLASVNGTWINGEQLQPRQPHLLQCGMEVVLGRSKTPELTFVVKPAAEATASAASSPPARMLDDSSSEGVPPPLAEETALPTMSRLFHRAQMCESQAQEKDEALSAEPNGERDVSNGDCAVATSIEPTEELMLAAASDVSATSDETGLSTLAAMEEPRLERKRHRIESSPAAGAKVLRAEGGSRQKSAGSVGPTPFATSASAPPARDTPGKQAVMQAAQLSGSTTLTSEDRVTTALSTSVLGWLVHNSKGTQRQPDWTTLRCIARLEATCTSLRHAVIIKGVWLSTLVARWGGPNTSTAEKLSRQLVRVITPAKSSCQWKERYATALRWMPCPYTQHGRRWINHQTSEETQMNPWQQYTGKRIVWKLPEDRSIRAQQVSFSAEYKDRSTGLVRLSGLDAADCVDGLVAGLPGGTEWIPPTEKLGSHVDLGMLTLPAFGAGWFPELTARLAVTTQAVPLTLSWETGHGQTSLVGILSSSRSEQASPYKTTAMQSTAKRLRFPLREPTDSDIVPCLCCGKESGPKLPGDHRCNSNRLKNEILLCDGCDGGFHLGCLPTPLEAVPPDDEWYCPSCTCGVKSRAGMQSLHALHAAKLVEISGIVTMDAQRAFPVMQILVRLKAAAFHYADADGGYCVAVPKEKARTDKLFPALLSLLVDCGNVRVGPQQDEYYRIDTYTPLSRPSHVDTKDFGVDALMESIRPPAVTPEVPDPVCLQFPLFPFQRKAVRLHRQVQISCLVAVLVMRGRPPLIMIGWLIYNH